MVINKNTFVEILEILENDEDKEKIEAEMKKIIKEMNSKKIVKLRKMLIAKKIIKTIKSKKIVSLAK